MIFDLNKIISPDAPDWVKDLAILHVNPIAEALPRYGLLVGQQIGEELKTFLIGDTDKSMLQYLIDHSLVSFKSATFFPKDKLVQGHQIYLTYNNHAHMSLKAPVTEHMSRCMNTRTKAIIEYKFIFDDECEAFIYDEIKTYGHYAISFADLIDGIEERLEGLMDNDKNNFRHIAPEDEDEEDFYQIRICDKVGDVEFIDINIQELKEALVSVRIADINVVIDDSLFYDKRGCCCIIEKDSKYLVGLRCKKEDKPEWCFPGGTVETDELPLEGVVREIKEEVNLDAVNINQVTMIRSGEWADYIFYCDVFTGIEKPQEGEFKELRWVTYEELTNGSIPVYPATLEAIEAYKKLEAKKAEQ